LKPNRAPQVLKGKKGGEPTERKKGVPLTSEKGRRRGLRKNRICSFGRGEGSQGERAKYTGVIGELAPKKKTSHGGAPEGRGSGAEKEEETPF